MRREARKRGLDPDQWLNNVEVVTAEEIGMEPTAYVRNIFKYYVSYKLTLEAQASAEKLKQQCRRRRRSEEHTSELQSLMRISNAVFCLKKKKKKTNQ